MNGPGRLVRARARTGFGGKRPTDPEANLVVPVVGGAPVAAGGAEIPRNADPSAAAEDTATAFAFFNPSRTVLRSPVVVLVLAILDPLRDIAMHVMETECIGGERADGSRPLIVPLAAAAVAIGVPFADLVAPRIGRLRSSTRRIFPFCLGEQPISFAGHPGEPGHIRLGVVPAHPNDRLSASSPATITGPVFVRAAADRDAGVPIGERHLELRDRRWPGYRDAMLWAFIPAALLGRRRSHRELARRDDNHLGTVLGAFAKRVSRPQRPLALGCEHIRIDIRDPVGPHCHV